MDTTNESPPLRTTILGSLLRGRPRNHSTSADAPTAPTAIGAGQRELSSSPSHPPSPGGLMSGHRRNRAGAGGGNPTVTGNNANTNSASSGVTGGSANTTTTTTTTSTTTTAPTTTTTTATNTNPLSNMLRRRRSAGALNASAPAPTAPSAPVPVPTQAQAPTPTVSTPIPDPHQPSPPTSHRIRLVPHIDSRRTLRFDAISRDLTSYSPPLRIGRFTDRSGLGLAAVNSQSSNRLAFKSKVVSRAHAEIWVEAGGKFFIRDTKSSSGTFLNHVRLSPANTESRPFAMKDGDVLQLGVDYQGGAEDIYKSVKIKIELGREWQAGANAFNTNTLKILKTLQLPTVPKSGVGVGPSISTSGSPSASTSKPHPPQASTSAQSSQIPDCCICLFSVTIRQALFIAPCSHTFHYKCIRPLLEAHHPAFSCPLCRTFADLEEDVEVEVDVEEGEAEEAEVDWEAEAGLGDGDGSGVEGGAEGSGVEGGASGSGSGAEAVGSGNAPATDPLIVTEGGSGLTTNLVDESTPAPPAPPGPTEDDPDSHMRGVEPEPEAVAWAEVGNSTGAVGRAHSASPQLVDELGMVGGAGAGAGVMGMDVDGTVGPGGPKGKGVGVVGLA